MYCKMLDVQCPPKVFEHHARFVDALFPPPPPYTMLLYAYKMNENGEMSWKSASHVLEHVHPSPQHCLRGERGAVCLENYNMVENINMQPMETCCSNYFWRPL